MFPCEILREKNSHIVHNTCIRRTFLKSEDRFIKQSYRLKENIGSTKIPAEKDNGSVISFQSSSSEGLFWNVKFYLYFKKKIFVLTWNLFGFFCTAQNWIDSSWLNWSWQDSKYGKTKPHFKTQIVEAKLFRTEFF